MSKQMFVCSNVANCHITKCKDGANRPHSCYTDNTRRLCEQTDTIVCCVEYEPDDIYKMEEE